MEWIQFRSSLARSHLDFWEENISAIIADIVEEPRAGCACNSSGNMAHGGQCQGGGEEAEESGGS